MSNFDAMLMQEFKNNKYLLSQKAAEDIDEYTQTFRNLYD